MRGAVACGTSMSASSVGEVDHDQPIHTGRRRIDAETFGYHRTGRVQVAHQDDRRRIVLAAEFAHHGQDMPDLDPGFQGALAGRLDDRTVGHRIGERHADFDQVGPRGRHPAKQGQGCGSVGIPGLDERDERTRPSRFSAAKRAAMRVTTSPPRCSATVKMSLSPSPAQIQSG